MIKKLWYLHPFLVALAPAVFLWQESFPGLPPKGLLPALAAVIFFAGLVFLVFWLFWRDIGRTAIFASVFLLLVLSHSYIYNSIFGRIFASGFLLHSTGFISSLTVLFLLLYFLKKTKKDLFSVNQVFAAVSGFFLLISFVQIWLNYQPVRRYQTETQVRAHLDGSAKLPDVYYIILDEYASPQVLKEVMGYEEVDGFVSFLEGRGFFVAKQSKSNYAHTELSLPSSLNIVYLEEPELNNFALRRKMLENHFLKDFFQSLGYRYVHSGTAWRTLENRYAEDNVITIGHFTYYQTSLWNTTAFYPAGLFVVRNFLGADALDLIDRASFLSNSVQYAKDTRFTLKELAKVPERPGPNFVFAHIMPPHRPYVFDADGNFLPHSERVKRSEKENYLGQVAYISREIMTLVDKILEESNPQPIIIIQADHGAHFLENPELRYHILNAYYFPDGGDEALYDTITPVNSFRVLLNYYFGQDLELLEDKIIKLDSSL